MLDLHLLNYPILTTIFLLLVSRYSKDSNLANNLWLEIFTHYSDLKRKYHNVSHLENLLKELTKVKDQISDWDTVLFSLFYHDVIYKASSSTNEEDSAKLASNRLQEIAFPKDKIDLCLQIILATKSLEVAALSDVNLFTDADLSILGKKCDVYQEYSQQVRSEFSIYPDFIYNSGRKKILENFLKMDRIFKTDHFYDKYETQARINITDEINDLGN